MKDSYKDEIADYYKYSAWLYRVFIYSEKSLGMHFGFWDRDTKNNDEALLNQFKFVLEQTKIKSGHKVLDAGCGVGGGAIYIAKNTGAKVVGITIVSDQVNDANKNAKRAQVSNLVDFRLMDYAKTSFEDNTFDVVFAIESICHAYPKIDFLNESYRILKPGGLLIMSDGYVKRTPKNVGERKIITMLCKVWRLKELIEIDKMNALIEKVGFKLVEVKDQASRVRPTFKRMRLLVFLACPLVWLSRYIKLNLLEIIKDNSDSMKYYAFGDALGLVGHYTHVARK